MEWREHSMVYPFPDQEPGGGWAGRSDQRPQAGAGGGLLTQQLEVLRSSPSDQDLMDHI